MAASVNKVILVGRLGKDPEIRHTQGGQAVANFSLATDESYKDRDGNKQKKTEWHNIVVWGQAVENFVEPYLYKGDMVYIEGKLQTRSWESDEGKKYTTEINVMDIKGLVTARVDDKPKNNNRPAAGSQRNTCPAQTRQAAPTPEVSDEDIPF